MAKQLSKVLLVFILGLSCIQGPWEYLPEDEQIFRGLTVNGYIISGRRVTEVCIERLYDLDEASTRAFPFYDSAYVTITGNGGNGRETIELSPRSDCPMCFEGPAEFTGQMGESYDFRAEVHWDSTGTDVVTIITGEARIPAEWKTDKIAKANKAAVLSTEGSDISSDPVVKALFGDLPSDVLSALSLLYLPEIAPIAEDTAAIMTWFSENGMRVQATIDSLLNDDSQLAPFADGDTLLYLGGRLNSTFDIFSVDYSDDVAGMLVTFSYDSNTIVATNDWSDMIAVFTPLTPAMFYYPGTELRVQFLPRFGEYGSESLDLYDRIPIPQFYLRSGKNTFYFYGTDSCYSQFVRTYIQQHSSSNVRPVHSVRGAQGYFVGMAVDSFTIYCKIPPDILSYTSFEARADHCNNNDWDSRDCRCFEPDYCQAVMFNDMQYGFDHPGIIREPEERSNCLAEAIAYYLSEGKPLSFVEDSLLTDGTTIEYDFREEDGSTTRKSRVFTDEELDSSRSEGLLRYCIRSDFSDPICFDLKAECREGDTPSSETLYTWCEDNGWQGAPCEWAIALYCREKDDLPKALCEKGNKWCENHPEDDICE